MMFKVGDKVVPKDGASQSFYNNHGMKEYYIITSIYDEKWLRFDNKISGWIEGGFIPYKNSGREELEKAMDVFEKYNLCRSSSDKYDLCESGRPNRPYISRRAVLEKLFPSEKGLKLKELQEQIKELQQTANELEKEING